MKALSPTCGEKVARVTSGGDEASRTPHVSRQAAAARARALAARPGFAVPRNRPACGLRHVRRRGAGRGHHHRDRPRLGARVRDRGERRHVKGGTYFPMTVRSTCACRRSRRRTGCPASTWSIPAAQTCRTRTRFSGPRAFRAHLLQPGEPLGRGHSADRLRDGLVPAGGAYVPAMSTSRSSSRARARSSSRPAIVKAATGEIVSAEDLGGAEVHTRTSGVSDQPRPRRCARARDPAKIVANLNFSKKAGLQVREPRNPFNPPKRSTA